ncbi:GTP-binding protein [Marinobacter sp. X15-166B]|uniref:GTP-binding protein n=1 Tax=Marinobacter sp. X15-166B TaxID=1897620 RepID=UPI00085BAF08|nr:GTPase domain-containing protein [Marinobacter sp. X15-166B]OEY66575.1 GTPase [Marinobacter sp. X15-166B]
MAVYNKKACKLTLKVVFYGPALSGKTTNLMQLHSLLHPERMGELMVLETRGDRTLFFDMLPIGLRAASGLDLRLKLFTVPGQVQHDSTRKAVLSRANAVVFVADSKVSAQDSNAAAFGDLEDNLDKVGLDIETLPLVIQFNKRDVGAVVPEDELQQCWAHTPWAPLTMASALQGDGVIETFRRLLDRLYTSADAEFSLARDHGIDRETFIARLSARHGVACA